MFDKPPATELATEPPAGGTEIAPVRARQLWLFPPPKPLSDRFGGAFFRALPKEPGVYFFFDETGRLIYIGKAKNLRQRVSSYRHVHPDRDSRKTWRLVNRVHRIEWETCPSHEEALLRESRLLREHRPLFNRANVWPWSAVYVGLKPDNECIRLKLDRNQSPEFEWFGAFKSFAIYAFSALIRLTRRHYGPQAAPLNWFVRDRAREFEIDPGRVSAPALREFLSGTSNRLLEAFEREAEGIGNGPLAHQNLVLNDLILLEEFFERGPKRNRIIASTRSQPSELITPEELVDWLAVQSA